MEDPIDITLAQAKQKSILPIAPQVPSLGLVPSPVHGTGIIYIIPELNPIVRSDLILGEPVTLTPTKLGTRPVDLIPQYSPPKTVVSGGGGASSLSSSIMFDEQSDQYYSKLYPDVQFQTDLGAFKYEKAQSILNPIVRTDLIMGEPVVLPHPIAPGTVLGPIGSGSFTPTPTLGLLIPTPTPIAPPVVAPPPPPPVVHKWELTRSGNQYIAYLDGKRYGSSQLGYENQNLERAGPNDIIIKDGVVIQEGAGAKAAAAAVAAQKAADAADYARHRAHEAEQASLLSGMKGAVASGEIRSAITPGLPIGVEALKSAELKLAPPVGVTAMKEAEKIVAIAKTITPPILTLTLPPVVGLEKMKVSEKASAEAKTSYAKSLAETTPAEAEAIAKMMKSPTATFSPDAIQKGYDIVTGKGISIKPEEVQAKVYVPPSLPVVSLKPPTQEQFDFTGRTSFAGGLVSMTAGEIAKEKAQQDIMRLSGLQNYNPITQASEKINANIQKQQDAYNQTKFNQDATYREYTSSNAPLSFRLQEGLRGLAANVGSFDVLSKNIEQIVSYDPFDKTQQTTEAGLFGKQGVKETSDYLKAREGYIKNVEAMKESDTSMFKIKTLARMSAESPIIQAQVGGFAMGGLFSGGSALARIGLSRASKESGAIIKFASSKLPASVGSKLFPEVAPVGAIGRGLEYAGKIPSLVPKALSKAEKLVEPGLTVGGLGYLGYDVATSKSKGEAGAKLLMLGVGVPYAKAGFEAGSQLVSRARLLGLSRPETNILNPRVEAGKETFPTTKAGEFVKFKQEFKTPEGKLEGYHATSEGYGSEPITVRGLQSKELRKSDVPGLYVSPVQEGPSTAFLRLSGTKGGKEPSLSFKSFFSSAPIKPEIYKISELGGVKRIKGGENVEKSREFFYSEKPKLGTAYIEPKMEMGGFRGEAQAVLPKGTQISAPLKTYKVRVKGHDVKYTERKIVSKTQPKISPEEDISFANAGKTESIFSYRTLGKIPSSRGIASAGGIPYKTGMVSGNLVTTFKTTPTVRTIPSSTGKPPRDSLLNLSLPTSKPPYSGGSKVSKPPSSVFSLPPSSGLSLPSKPPSRPPSETPIRPPISRPPSEIPSRPPSEIPSRPPSSVSSPFPREIPRYELPKESKTQIFKLPDYGKGASDEEQPPKLRMSKALLEHRLEDPTGFFTGRSSLGSTKPTKLEMPKPSSSEMFKLNIGKQSKAQKPSSVTSKSMTNSMFNLDLPKKKITKRHKK